MKTLTLALLLTFIFSCSSEEKVKVNSDEAELNKRMSEKSEILEVYSGYSEEGETSLALSKKKKVETTFKLTLIGELASPSIEGTTLQATDIYNKGNKAYISYNVAGEEKKGALDQLDIKDETKPYLTSSMSFADRDVNALFFKSNTLYITGSWNQSSLSYLSKIPASTSKFTTENIEDAALSGFAGNDVFVSSNDIYVTTGSNGGLYTFKKSSFEQTDFIDIPNARAVDEYNSSEGPWVLTGEPAKLTNGDDTYNLGGATIAESKSTLQAEKKWILATTGENGFSVFCPSQNKTIFEQNPPEIERDHDKTPVTNAAIAVKNFVFTANGEEGVHVYEMGENTSSKSCSNFELSYLGYIDLGENLSANHISSDSSGEYIYVANGLGGLKIIHGEFVEIDDDDNDD